MDEMGPFSINGSRFSVLLTQKEIEGDLPGANAVMPWTKTVSSFEIKDETGRVHYFKSFNNEAGIFGFGWSAEVAAYRLEGERGEGLILFTESAPSAPSSGRDCQIFALKDARMIPLSPPVTVYGTIYDLPKGSMGNSLRLFANDTIRFGVWTGNYEVLVPIVVDFEKFKLRPQESSGLFDIDVSKNPPQEGAVVKLYPDRSPRSEPKSIIITKDIPIEFIQAYAEVVVDNSYGGDFLSVHLRSNSWLKVKVGGIEGWVRDEGDLNALGLHSAG